MAEPELRKPGRPKDPDLEQRRKTEILAAAAKAFAAKGFADADVQQIADGLGLGKGTVYRYFPTKQALFLAAVDRGLQELSAEIDGIFESRRDPLELVREAITAYLRFFHSRPEMAELFIQERAVFRDRHTPLYFAEKYQKQDRDEQFVHALIRLGRFRKIKPAAVLEIVGDLLYGTVLANHLTGRTMNPRTQANAILDLLFQGLLSDGERKRIQKRSVKKSLVMTAILALGFAGCGGANTGSSGPGEPEPIVITAEPLTTRTLPRTITAVGTLNGFEELTLAPKVEGRVIAVRAQLGDRVAPDTPLLELDPKDYDLAIAEAKQALAAELAKLDLTELPVGDFDVYKVPGVQRATASADDARRRLKQKQSIGGGAASPDEIQLLETEVRIADAVRKHAVSEAQATLSAARLRKASLDVAQQRRADCTLKAPVPSEWLLKCLPPDTAMKYAVAAKLISEGEMVRSMPVTNAFKLVLDFSLKLNLLLPERHVPDVKIGQVVEIRADASPGRVLEGKIIRVNPTIDPVNRTFNVEVEIPNAQGELKAGGFAKATILVKSDPNVRTVPPSALVYFAGVYKVFVKDGDKAKAVEVKIGSRDKDWIEVKGEFPNSAVIITSGLTKIVDGSAVKLRD